MTLLEKLQVFDLILKYYSFDFEFLEYLLENSIYVISILQIATSVEEIFLIIDILYNIYT